MKTLDAAEFTLILSFSLNILLCCLYFNEVKQTELFYGRLLDCKKELLKEININNEIIEMMRKK